MDDYTPPGRSEDFPADPRGLDRLVSHLHGVRRELADLPHGLLKQAGITVEPDTIRFGGNVAIEGTLSLPAGIIDNEALANPISTGTGFGDADGFSIAAADSNVCSFGLVVPAGYTKALVTALGVAFCYNDSGTFTYMRARVFIDSPGASTWGRRLIAPVQDGSSNTLAVNKQAVISNLNGGEVLTCRLVMSSDFATLNSGSNGASINAVALFLR